MAAHDDTIESRREKQFKSWQTNIILTAGVMVTVLMALILAQLDALQVRAVLERPGLPIVNIQATAVAIGQIIPLNRESDGQPPVAVPVAESLGPVPDDLNPRPDFITGVSEEGVIFTVCGAVPEGWLLYTVQPGDTLASLAEATQSTTAELSAANCLTSEQVSGGMQLLVPQQPAATLCGPPQWWVRYQVQVGDTLTRLAASRGTTVDEILRANCRETLELQVGQFIFLPPGAPAGGVAPPQPSLTPLPTPTPIPTLAPLPTVTSAPPPVQPSATAVIILPTPTRFVPTIPAPPTSAPPTFAPPTFAPPTAPPPTSPPPTSPPPTSPPPTSPPPTSPPPTSPPPTSPPPTSPPPTSPPPTEPPPTSPPPTEPPPTSPPPTEPPPTEPPPTEPPPTDPPPTTEPPPPPPDEGG